jgi:hypothetical protein
MAKSSAATKPARGVKNGAVPAGLQEVFWRLDRLERQVQKLVILVRDHAEDEDRLVRIVAEDRELLRRQMVRQHQQRLRVRKRAHAES